MGLGWPLAGISRRSFYCEEMVEKEPASSRAVGEPDAVLPVWLEGGSVDTRPG